MAYRKLKNIKSKILNEALEIGATEGVYNITARKSLKIVIFLLILFTITFYQCVM